MQKTEEVWMLLDILHKSVDAGYPNILAWARRRLAEFNVELHVDNKVEPELPLEKPHVRR